MTSENSNCSGNRLKKKLSLTKLNLKIIALPNHGEIIGRDNILTVSFVLRFKNDFKCRI